MGGRKTEMVKKKECKAYSFEIDPLCGMAWMAVSIKPPKGYKFESLRRRGSRVTVRFQAINEEKNR